MEPIQLHEQVQALTQGAYDLHIHPAPSHMQRLLDDVQAYQQAAAHKMGGIMIKNHYEPTTGRAQLVNTHFKQGETRALGAVVLNWPVGGLNPYAVESTCRLGGRMVWMPTRDAGHCLRWGDMPGDFFHRPGISVLAHDGSLLPAVLEILEVARSYQVPVATGHLGIEESIRLCRQGVVMGNKMVLTHPEWARTKIPLQVQLDLAGQGVFIEKCWLNVVEGDCSQDYFLQTIQTLGSRRVFLSTDSGKPTAPPPLESLQAMLNALLRSGFSSEIIRIMCQENPAWLVSENGPTG